MKKLFLLVIPFLWLKIQAQNQVLDDLSTGHLVGFEMLYEGLGNEKELYGYYLNFITNNPDENTVEFEYVILDKNLNKVLNGRYLEHVYKNSQSDVVDVQKFDDKVLVTGISRHKRNTKLNFTSYRILDLSKNEMGDSFYLDEGEFKDGIREDLKHEKKEVRAITILQLVKDGILVYYYPKDFKYANEITKFQVFDMNRELRWEEIYNPANSFGMLYPIMIDQDEIATYWIKPKMYQYGSKVIEVRVFDQSNGEDQLYAISDFEDVYDYWDYFKNDNQRVFVLETYRNAEKMEIPETGKKQKVGDYFEIRSYVDDSLAVKKRVNFYELSKYVEDIDLADGALKGNYKLHYKNGFLLKNGTLWIVFEKTKEKSSSIKTTDFVLFRFDKEMEIKEVQFIEKEKSKHNSDYLFSQMVDDGNKAVFFFRDYKKSIDENWKLGITVLSEEGMTYNEIPMTTEDYSIYPYIAKEDYIMLREYNKEEETDEIRLERLNY